MTRLLLHVGSHKTGTTSLQSVFYDNRRWMRKRKLCYPIIAPYKRETEHLRLSRALIHDDPAKRAGATEFFRNLDKVLRPDEAVLLSSEAIYRHVTGPDDHLMLDDAAYFDRRRDYLARWAELLRDYDVEVVLALRNFDDYMQFLKRSATRLGIWDGSNAAFHDRYAERYAYSRQIDLFREVFPVLHLLDFEAGRKVGLATQFFRAIGFAAPPGGDDVWLRPTKGAPQVVSR